MRLNQFDRVAPFYDGLARFVFGNSIRNAQTVMLEKINGGAEVLVLGGGTGWWLPQLAEANPTCRVLFVDASEKMIRIARKPASKFSNVFFVHGVFEDVPASGSFDVVITYFFLDLFSDVELEKMAKKIKGRLNPGGMWLIAEFVSTRWWHRILLGVMYSFFRLTCQLTTKALPLWRTIVEREGLKCAEEHRFFGSFISSCRYEGGK